MIYGSVYGSVNESTLYDVAPYEFEESMSFQEMGAQMIEEATQDWNDYMQAIALTELTYVIENGQEYLYEGVDISAMLGKVKEWFKKLWAKIQGIAKAAMAKFASFGKNDEAFINKYEKDIHTGATKLPAGFSFKGYTFTGIEKGSSVIDAASKNLLSASPESIYKPHNQADLNPKEYNTTKQLDEKVDMHRGVLVGAPGKKVTSGEFKKELRKHLYGSADKEYIKTVDAGKLIGIVKGAKEAIDAAKDAESAIKDSIDAKIDILDGIEDDIRKEETKPEEAEKRNSLNDWAASVNRYSSYLKNIESVNALWFSTYITALKDQNRQAKAVCVKLISFANGVGGKKESKNESASLLEDRFNAIFD